MPTTLSGLLLFVVMLLPGFAYLIGKERHGTERRLSPFRETVAIVAASITAELFVLLIFAGVRILWPSITPDVGALAQQGTRYLWGTQGRPGHYASVGAWGVGLLAMAIVVAYLATEPRVRRLAEKVTGPYPHESTVSAWWVLFEQWSGGRDVELVCMLDDGSCVRGEFGSFNTSADDSPDRDLILKRPIYYRPPGPDSEEVFYDVAAMCCSAGHIVALFVNYADPDPQSPTLSTEVAAAVQLPSMTAPEASQSTEAPMPEAV